MSQDAVAAALRDLQASVDRLRADTQAKDAEIARLREAVAERDGRIRALGEQALHLMDLLHEARAAVPPSPPR